MEKKLLSEQELLEDSFVESEYNLEKNNGVLSRRDAIKKTLIAAVAFSLSTIPVDALADNNADKAKEKKEAERKEIYEMVKQLGLEKIKNREKYTLKFFLPGKHGEEFWNILKIRFKGVDQSAIFYESWLMNQEKPFDLYRYPVDAFTTLMDVNFKNGKEVLPLSE